MVLVLGATGRSGKWLIKELLDAGYDVRVLVRNPDDILHLKNKVEIVQGDATNYQCLYSAMKECHAVLSTLGPTRLRRKAAKELVCSKVSQNVIKAASELTIKRYIVVSGAAVSLPQDRRNFYGWLSSLLVPLFVWHVLKDKKIEAKILQDSNLDWTLVRCPEITNSAYKKEPDVSIETQKWLQVRAGELARFLVRQIEDDAYLKKGVFISSRF